MRKIKLLSLLAAMVCAKSMWAWSGSGTSGDPYLIASESDWNTLATNVNGGNSYRDKYFQLTVDITVSEMVGTSDHEFRGIFNGNGHTLTFNKGTSDEYFGEEYCAPFRYTWGATFKRLRVAGTIYTSQKFAAGMVGIANGNDNYFQSCQSSISIYSTKDGDGTHAGFMANNRGNSYFINCLFDGSFIGSSTSDWGGFIGWTANIYNAYFTNCLLDPSALTINSSGSANFSRGYNATFTNCYRNVELSINADQGTATILSGNTVYNLNEYMWEYSGGKVIPIIHPYSNLPGNGTADDPYLITSTTDWDVLASYVNNGDDFSGIFIKLTSDIEVSEMVGTESNRFSGLFNGDGHTLTFTKGTSGSRYSAKYCAPFSCINGATFKSLHVTGTIFTSNQNAGMVGHAKGTNNFQRCRCSLTIDTSVSGDGTHGGFIANNNNGAVSNFTDCLFDGSFIGASTTNCGGFVGWTEGNQSSKAYFTNCLFDPAGINFSDKSGCKEFSRSRNTSDVTISNCYYKQTFSAPANIQGTDASSMSNDALLAALGKYWQISGGKVIPLTQALTLTGDGTEGSPYLIATTADWEKLAFNVTYGGESYAGKYFRQTADITITSPVGSNECLFGGFFDGDGHVLHLNIQDVSSGTAPFRYIKDATIQYVMTDGLLVGGNNCSGLVGIAKGTNLIQGCEVAAEVYCNSSHCGGILGHGMSSNTTIQDCLFSGVLEGAGTSTGIIFGWGDTGEHTIINCLSFGNCVGGTVKMIAGNGTKTLTNSYHSTTGPTDGTDASSMSRAELQAALGANWGTRGSHVVPIRFAVAVTPQVGVAEVDLESDYVPTQIINGNFGVRPWMSYKYNGEDYMSYNDASTVGNDKEITESYPNGVNGGWNSTEEITFDRGLFEYLHSVGNGNIPTYGGCVEMNSQNCAVLWQDLTTHANDVIRWSLLHAVRTNYGPDVQSMRVEVGSPEYSGGNIVAATGINSAVDSKINTDTKATYDKDGYSGDNAKGGDNLAKLSLQKNTAPDNNAWHQVRGIYLIPDGQTVTRFAFISTSTDTDQKKMSAGNYLDNLAFSTLIGNLSAEQLPTGDVVLKGYWGETDASKHLVVKIGSTPHNYDMTSVANENFKLTIPASTIGSASTLSVYHEDYSDAKRTIGIAHSITMASGTVEATHWTLSSNFALAGTSITLDYSGKGTVQSVILRNVQDPTETASVTEVTANSQWSFDMPSFNTEVVVTIGFDITANQDPQHAGVYYSTFYYGGSDVLLPADVEAYTATIRDDALYMKKVAVIGQTIPLDNAVILKSNAQNYTLIASAIRASDFEGNALRGVDVATPVSDVVTSGTCYVLSGHSTDNSVTGVGFYQYSGTLGAHKAYVVVGNNAPKRMRFVFDTETGIDPVTDNPSPVTQKILRDGQLIIIRNGVEYNVNGQIIK